jgi:hypothetical protein
VHFEADFDEGADGIFTLLGKTHGVFSTGMVGYASPPRAGPAPRKGMDEGAGFRLDGRDEQQAGLAATG